MQGLGDTVCQCGVKIVSDDNQYFESLRLKVATLPSLFQIFLAELMERFPDQAHCISRLESIHPQCPLY
ncbi:MAG: hypothetical protein M2R45_01360 [Verrucomicrobia subdivision 3 bacterium]|nr:hypothetical protein [Limisphaerales bacterium]